MATIDFTGLYAEVNNLIPKDKKGFPVKRLVDTIIRANVEDYFDQYNVVTSIELLWESLGATEQDHKGWVKDIEVLISDAFDDAMEDNGKAPDYHFATKYKDGFFRIPYMVTEPRQSPGFKLKAKIDFSILAPMLKESLRFDNRFNPAVDDSTECERFDTRNLNYLSKDLIVHYFKTELHGFRVPSEHPFRTYYTHDELVELAYAITVKESGAEATEERFEDDVDFDLINFVFEPVNREIEVLLSHVFSELGLTQSTVVELYQASGKVWVYVSNETIEEMVFREVFNVEESRVVIDDETGSREYCKCFI